MTGKRKSDDPARSAKAGGTATAGKTKADKTEADKTEAADGSAKALEPDAPAAAAKASVHEAIGKLIGDDAERERGAAEKEATEIKSDKPSKPPSRR